MNELFVTKRDGRKVPFVLSKISDAIYAAAKEVGGSDYETAQSLAVIVEKRLKSESDTFPSVEHIQDLVEKVLMENGHAKTAKAFIIYRNDRTRVREMNTGLMKTLEELTLKNKSASNIKRENGNIDADTAMGTMLKYGSETAKKFNLYHLIPKRIADAHINGDIHIHK